MVVLAQSLNAECPAPPYRTQGDGGRPPHTPPLKTFLMHPPQYGGTPENMEIGGKKIIAIYQVASALLASLPTHAHAHGSGTMATGGTHNITCSYV